MSSIYSRYASAASGGYVRVGGVSVPPFVRNRQIHETRDVPKKPPEKAAEKHGTPAYTAPPQKNGSPGSFLSGRIGALLSEGASGLFPKGLDTGDILMLALFLLLYLESGDEDFLIFLVVTAFSVFK